MKIVFLEVNFFKLCLKSNFNQLVLIIEIFKPTMREKECLQKKRRKSTHLKVITFKSSRSEFELSTEVKHKFLTI